MKCRINFVDKLLTKSFYKLGLLIAKYPGYFLIIPILVTCICVTGYQKIHFQMDPEFLFSPTEGHGKTERTIVESHFKVNYSSRFNPSRITRPGRYARVIVLPKRGNNMLTVDIWKELRLLDSIIKNVTIVFGEESNEYRYNDMCAKWINNCFENDILNLDFVMDKVEKKQLNLTFPVMFNPVTWDAHTFPAYFGGTVLNEDGLIVSVPSVQLAYFVTSDTRLQDSRGAAWEEAFLEAIERAENSGLFKYISTARFASRTLDIELEKNTRSVIPYFGSTFLIMTIFSVVTCMMGDWVRSKPILGLLGNVSAVMGTMAAFGFAIYCNVDFIGINFVSPLLMCSIGIDDTFVMLASWRKTPITMSVPERMANMLSDAAVSITITSLTDLVSLWIGQNSPFPAIQIFCIYSAFAVVFIYVWHITFFAACVALNGYMEQDNRHSITCLKVNSNSLSHERSWFYKLFCSGGINVKDPDNEEDNPEHKMMAWCRDSLGTALTQWPVKVLIIAIFIGYLIGALHGFTKIEEGLQRRKLSKSDSYSIEFYDREDFYFREFPYRIQVVLSGEFEYWDSKVQEDIENMTRTFEASPYISTSLYTESWLRSFIGYVERNKELLNVTIDSKESFITTLKQLWLFKPNPFSLDIKFNDNGTSIVASRFMIQAVNITDGNIEKDMVKDLRRIAKQFPFNVTVFHPYFVFFDQFELVRPTSMQSMLLGGIIMMIITFIFIPNVIASIWVAISIISIQLGVLGYMSLWKVNLDSISMVNLIMCVGYSVDFTAHICYAYISSQEETAKERVKESLHSMGIPIIQGALSTILGVSALLFTGSYIFLVFFKMIFLVIFFGALHGLLLLPVLLSIAGPGACKKPKKKIEMEKFPRPYLIPHPTLSHPAKQFSNNNNNSNNNHNNNNNNINNNNNFKQYGIPLHGMVQAISVVYPQYDLDKYNKFISENHDKEVSLGLSNHSNEPSVQRTQKVKRLQEDKRSKSHTQGHRKSNVTRGHQENHVQRKKWDKSEFVNPQPRMHYYPSYQQHVTYMDRRHH